MRGDNRMKKIFVDVYLRFNLGDDLFLDILAKKYTDCEFTVNYLGKDYDQFISLYTNVYRRKYTVFHKIGQRLNIKDSITNYDDIAKEHDALLFIGGSIFREESYHNSLYKDRMSLVQEFKKRNKPVFILGANFGPFETKRFLEDYRSFFELCDDICFRDLYSYELFKELPQVRYAPDIVFQMKVDEYRREFSGTKVGISVIDVRHKAGLSHYYKDYIDSTIQTIELLVDKGYQCCLMSFCEEEGDSKVINEIMPFLSPQARSNVTIYEYKGDLKEAINLIASFKLLIGARFHANILALLLGIGIMPIIYNQKTTNMLNDIKLNSIKINMDDLHLQYEEHIINKSFSNKTNLEYISKQAEKQFQKLSEFIMDKEVITEGI